MPKSYHHGELRPALINAAIALITEKQDTKTISLREVARRVGVSQAAPYRHFADKEALLAAVAEQGFQILTQELEASIAKVAPNPLEQLQASGIAYVQFAIAHPAHYRVMFSALRPGNPNYPELNQAGNAAFGVMVTAIAQGQAQGNTKPGEPRSLAIVAWSLVHGLAMLLIEGQLTLPTEAEQANLIALVTRSLVYGLQAESSVQR
ncbi:MAG: TetR/AcrR family transcriptional regulator [Cyanobacteria bacterium P01_G01_bin.54]